MLTNKVDLIFRRAQAIKQVRAVSGSFIDFIKNFFIDCIYTSTSANLGITVNVQIIELIFSH
jgi:uncharacterized protein YlbG (UPF0298 family)